ncbi:transposable element Tcb2 transposase [Trichonephila clavipes]|nr:transposable element Tcb2 transposase [Trichonephila clavipes]
MGKDYRPSRRRIFLSSNKTTSQWSSSTLMRARRQRTEKHRTTRKTSNGRRKVKSARDNQHLLRMTVNDRRASSRQLAVTGVLILASSIHRRLLHSGLRAWAPLYKILFTTNHRRLRLQWAHEHRTWQANWH